MKLFFFLLWNIVFPFFAISANLQPSISSRSPIDIVFLPDQVNHINSLSDQVKHINSLSLEHPSVRLAIRDLQRYLRILTCGYGILASINCTSLPSQPRFHIPNGYTILLGSTDAVSPYIDPHYRTIHSSLRDDDHHIHAHILPVPNHTVIICTGATPRSLMYSVYTLLERIGARFYITGDVLPSISSYSRTITTFESLIYQPIHNTPRFAVRGIQPFHDFPMGPDFWTLDFYKQTATQLNKMKMNIQGYHTYPIGGPTEPFVWVGTAAGYDSSSGSVYPWAAYESSWYLTQNFSRGNLPGSISRATSEYSSGSASIFPRDCYGSDAQSSTCFPFTPTTASQVFDNAAALLGEAFAFSNSIMGVEACAGTEMPLTPPANEQPNATLQELYEGIFGRIMASPMKSISCYWLWTTEGVEDHGTGKGLPQNNPLWAQLTNEIEIAIAARNNVAPNLTLGTNGWCLGPGDNSSYFDKVIMNDPTFVISSIDPLLGWANVDNGYANVTNHRGWQISWMEDDMGLSGAELWVNRTLWHSNDAASYGVDGILGLLWRTFETSPQITALATAGWTANVSAYDIYYDFCASNFGNDTAAVCAQLFLDVDGTSDPTSPNMVNSILPRGGQGCCGGPLSPTGEEGPIRFLNTTGFETWLTTVTGAANYERALRWVSLFLYHNAMAWVSTAGQALQVAAALVTDEATAREYGFPALTQLTSAYTDMLTLLLQFTTTPGELGMIVAHEGMNWPSNFLPAAGPILAYIAECVSYNAPTAYCYVDNNIYRTFPYTVTISDSAMTRELCASSCLAAGYAYAGVEFGVACFCGNTLPSNQTLPISDCANMTCAGAKGEYCGGPDILSVYPSTCPSAPGLPPNLLPSKTYVGTYNRLFPTVARTTVTEAEETVTIEMTVLSSMVPVNVTLTWWIIPSNDGTEEMQVGSNTTVLMDLVTVNRALYSTDISLPSDSNDVIEYIVEVYFPDWTTLIYPVEGAQSIVIV